MLTLSVCIAGVPYGVAAGECRAAVTDEIPRGACCCGDHCDCGPSCSQESRDPARQSAPQPNQVKHRELGEPDAETITVFFPVVVEFFGVYESLRVNQLAGIHTLVSQHTCLQV